MKLLCLICVRPAVRATERTSTVSVALLDQALDDD
jgi:hypothetical protein